MVEQYTQLIASEIHKSYVDLDDAINEIDSNTYVERKKHSNSYRSMMHYRPIDFLMRYLMYWSIWHSPPHAVYLLRIRFKTFGWNRTAQFPVTVHCYFAFYYIYIIYIQFMQILMQNLVANMELHMVFDCEEGKKNCPTNRNYVTELWLWWRLK